MTITTYPDQSCCMDLQSQQLYKLTNWPQLPTLARAAACSQYLQSRQQYKLTFMAGHGPNDNYYLPWLYNAACSQYLQSWQRYKLTFMAGHGPNDNYYLPWLYNAADSQYLQSRQQHPPFHHGWSRPDWSHQPTLVRWGCMYLTVSAVLMAVSATLMPTHSLLITATYLGQVALHVPMATYLDQTLLHGAHVCSLDSSVHRTLVSSHSLTNHSNPTLVRWRWMYPQQPTLTTQQ